MEYKIPVTSKGYYKAILTILNFSLNMSKLELDILAVLLYHNMLEINADSREIIRKELDKDKFITNNYIKSLKAKGIILTNPTDPKKAYVNPEVVNIVKEPKLSFEFIINDHN